MGIPSFSPFLLRVCLRPAGYFATVFAGLSLFFQQSGCAQVVSSVEQTTLTSTRLPAAAQKIVAAIYPFRLSTDQSSQATDNTLQRIGVTHYTEVLLDVLRTSGWFIPAEYSNTGDLLNGQRDKPLVSSTVDGSVNSALSLKPTVIVEAGLFSHDETTILDEAAHTHFPGSVSNRYRQNRATVFLRLLSAQSGKILKTIYWTKTVLSKLAGGNTYQYVFVGEPNLPPAGTTSVSPSELVIVEAVKQAVTGLVIEGIQDGLWMPSNVSAEQIQALVAAYEAERINLIQPEETAIPTRKIREIVPPFISLCFYGGLMRYHGDYVNWDTKGAYGLSVEAYATPRIGIHLNAASGVLSSQNAFSTHLTAVSLNLMVRVMPYWRFTPLVYGGIGMVSRTTENPFNFQGSKYLQYQGGLGLQYSLNNTVGFRTMLTYNLPMTDLLDGKQLGSHNDFYVQTTLGLLIHFGQYVPGPTRKSSK